MMKKQWMINSIAGLAGLLVMSGCGAQIPNLTDEQLGEVAEYAAVTMLKYDAANRSRLVDDEVIIKYDEKQQRLEELRDLPIEDETIDADKDNPNGDNNQKQESQQIEKKYDQLNDFYQFSEGVSLNFDGYSVMNSYPEEGSEDWMSITATSGKQLLVLRFSLKNQSSQQQDIDFFSYNATYRITVQGEKEEHIGIMQTLLMDDLSSYLEEGMPAGTERKLVLLTELSEETLADIQGIEMKIKNSEQSKIIKLY